MTTNERIALALGWWREPSPSQWWGHATDTNAIWSGPLPDYEHSLDALLEPLGVLKERGWWWEVGEAMHAGRAYARLWHPQFGDFGKLAASPSEALALAVAEALEQA